MLLLASMSISYLKSMPSSTGATLFTGFAEGLVARGAITAGTTRLIWMMSWSFANGKVFGFRTTGRPANSRSVCVLKYVST